MMGASSSLCAGKPAREAGQGYGALGYDLWGSDARIAARGTTALLAKTGPET